MTELNERLLVDEDVEIIDPTDNGRGNYNSPNWQVYVSREFNGFTQEEAEQFKKQFMNNQAIVERIKEKVKELIEFQEGYFFENPKRHCNDEEITTLYNFLGEKFTPTTFEEDRQQFIEKIDKLEKTKHSNGSQRHEKCSQCTNGINAMGDECFHCGGHEQ